MTESPPHTRQTFRLRNIFAGIGVVLIGLCLLPEVILSPLLGILFGWLIYLFTTFPKLSFSLDGFATGLVLFSLTTGGLFYWLGQRNATSTPDVAVSDRTKGQRLWLSLRTTIAIVVLFVSGLCLIGIVHQAGWIWNYSGPYYTSGVGEQARRSQSQDYVHNLVISIHNYSGDRGHNSLSPAGGTFSEQGVGQHGWITFTLPYIEQRRLYDQVDFTRPWNAPVNQPAMAEELYILQNPGVWGGSELTHGPSYGSTHYVGNEHLMGPNRFFHIDQIPDGASHTIFMGEIVSRIPPWGAPTNYRDPSLGIGRHPHGFGGPWADGSCIFGMLDGKTVQLNPDIDPAVLKALSTPNGSDNPGKGW